MGLLVLCLIKCENDLENVNMSDSIMLNLDIMVPSNQMLITWVHWASNRTLTGRGIMPIQTEGDKPPNQTPTSIPLK